MKQPDINQMAIASLDQQWAAALDWYRSGQSRDAALLMARLHAGKIRQMTTDELRFVAHLACLAIGELCVRSEARTAMEAEEERA